MPNPATFLAWAESIAAMNYYDILRCKRDATDADVKAAFHAFALRCHPDRYVDDGQEVGLAAAEVFKRGVEAYNVLVRPDLRKKYDTGLARGKLRLDPAAPDSVPPKPKGKMLVDCARTTRGKQFAIRADRLISIGKLEEARIQLTCAISDEPDNDELRERLDGLYTMIMLSGN
jgi:curved DNA-binding protein CbpA